MRRSSCWLRVNDFVVPTHQERLIPSLCQSTFKAVKPPRTSPFFPFLLCKVGTFINGVHATAAASMADAVLPQKSSYENVIRSAVDGLLQGVIRAKLFVPPSIFSFSLLTALPTHLALLGSPVPEENLGPLIRRSFSSGPEGFKVHPHLQGCHRVGYQVPRPPSSPPPAHHPQLESTQIHTSTRRSDFA